MMFKYLLLILLLNTSAIFPQSKDVNIDPEFNRGLGLLNSYQYEEALDAFSRIVDNEESNSVSAALLFKGKILFSLNRQEEGMKTFEYLTKEYPASKYIDESKIITSKYYFDKGEYLKSFTLLCEIIRNSTSQDYRSYARYTGEKIARLFLSKDELASVYSSFSDTKAASYLLLAAGKVALKNRDFKEADDNFVRVLQDYPQSEDAAEAAELHKKTKFSSDEIVIAALLPLTSNGEKNNSALAILEGIKYALAEYNNGTNHKAGLVIQDTEKDSIRIKEICKELKNLQSLKAFIGPVYSDEVKTVLNEFNGLSIPLISPTATESDLTMKYSNFFQANPSLGFRGKIMAQYIYYVENKKKMAVLNAADGYSSTIADAFKEEYKKLGGKIIVEEAYKSGGFDINKQVSRIASKMKNIEGVYLPLTDKNDAAIVLSQLEANNVNVNLYGNQDWLNAKGFESSSNLSNKLIFTSDYFIDFNDPGYQDFNKKFREVTGIEADRNVLYGYDAAKYLLTAFDGENLQGDALIKKLYSGQVFQGFHNNISFDSERMNQFLNILRYKDGIFELVDRFRVGNK